MLYNIYFIPHLLSIPNGKNLTNVSTKYTKYTAWWIVQERLNNQIQYNYHCYHFSPNNGKRVILKERPPFESNYSSREMTANPQEFTQKCNHSDKKHMSATFRLISCYQILAVQFQHKALYYEKVNCEAWPAQLIQIITGRNHDHQSFSALYNPKIKTMHFFPHHFLYMQTLLLKSLGHVLAFQ